MTTPSRLILATHNKHKLEEFRALIPPAKWQLTSLGELGMDIHWDETGSSFYANARIKAEAIRAVAGDSAVLADDSGLVVPALGGAPGIYSARYAGPDASAAENNSKLLQAMQGLKSEERRAYFVCCLVSITADGQINTAEHEFHGRIMLEPHGAGGFGYDPIFYVDAAAQSLAALSAAAKNRLSHRGLAVAQWLSLS